MERSPCVLKSKSYLNLCTSISVHKKPSLNLYAQVYFDRRDQFNSMGSSDTWSDNFGQTCRFSCVFLRSSIN